MKYRKYFRHATVLAALTAFLIFAYNVSTTVGAEPGTSLRWTVAAGDLRVSAHRLGIEFEFEIDGDTIIVSEGKTILLTIKFNKPTKTTVRKDIIPLLKSDDPAERLDGLKRAEEKYGSPPSLTADQIRAASLLPGGGPTGFRLFRRVLSRRVLSD